METPLASPSGIGVSSSSVGSLFLSSFLPSQRDSFIFPRPENRGGAPNGTGWRLEVVGFQGFHAMIREKG